MHTLIRGLAHVRVFVRPGQWSASLSFYRKALGLKCLDPATGLFALPDGLTLVQYP